MHDVAIVGGGPGGLYAALHLARRGFDVVLFEEHEVPGEPVHCTGVLADEAFAEFDLPRTSILNPLRTAVFFGPSGGSIEYTTPSTEAVVIDRRQFDRLLSEQTKAAGVTLTVGHRVTDVAPSQEGVTVTAHGVGITHARAAILACGASYSIQRRLGFGMPSVHLQSAQLEVPAAALGPVEVHFGNQIAPKGFAWVVPVEREHGTFARVGLMCESNAREHFGRFIASVSERWRIAPLPSGMDARAKILPLGPIERTFAPRVLAIGDAAGLVKATTGGGIYYSLVSARIATEVLAYALASDRLDEDSLSCYETRWREALGEEMDTQMELRRVAHQLPDEDIDALFELARTDGIMPIVRRTAQFNRHRRLIVSLLNHPPARHLLMRRVLGWGRIA
jgi:digeranylgeranylglycerophospholipid reductase